MKLDNNNDKLRLIKSFIILKMLQQSTYFINSNKESKKKSTNTKQKNRNPNNSIAVKNSKDKINTEFMHPMQEVTIDYDSEFILPIYEKSNIAKFLIILKKLQQPFYNENIYKKLKNNSINIKYENILKPNKISLVSSSEDKVNMKYIHPIVKAPIEENIECIKAKDEIKSKVNDINKTPEKINTNQFEKLISTIPIIIAEKNIDIPIEATFRLKNAALDIKNIKKDIYLTNSKLIPMHGKEGSTSCLQGKLFLEGTVRNKLDFSIVKGVNDSIINLDIESVIIYIPFKCTTIIEYKVPPVFSKCKGPDYIPIYISPDCLNINNDYKEYLTEKNTQSNEYINCDVPPINCEIEKYKIYQTHTLLDKRAFSEDFPFEMSFHTIKESIILNLSLSLIQKQDVGISYIKNSK